MKRVYLDYAAATPLDSSVKIAMDEAGGVFANPSSQYASGREAKEALDSARKEVAMFLGAKPAEIVLTNGATEANNLAIFGVASNHKKGRIISVATEHASVREPLERLKQEGYDVQLCQVDRSGRVDTSELTEFLTTDTLLVSVAYASGEIGTIQQIAKIVRLVRDFEKANNCKIIVHTDASAAALLLPCDVSRLGVDLLTLGASKIYGPTGIGALYVRWKTPLLPMVLGGHQEFGLRAGTEGIALAAGFAQSLRTAKQRRQADAKQFAKLTSEFMSVLDKKGKINRIGHPKQRLANLIVLSFDVINGEDIVAHMDAAGFEFATGAACQAAKTKPSQALLALGLSKSEAQGSVRISIGRDTTKTDMRRAAKALIDVLDRLGYKWV